VVGERAVCDAIAAISTRRARLSGSSPETMSRLGGAYHHALTSLYLPATDFTARTTSRMLGARMSFFLSSRLPVQGPARGLRHHATASGWAERCDRACRLHAPRPMHIARGRVGLGIAAAFVASCAVWASTETSALAQGPSQASANTPAPETVPEPSTAMANRGLQLGIRMGYAFGSGVVYSGLSVMDGSHGAMPLIGDIGIRFLPWLYAGLYGQYAPVFTRPNDVECFQGFQCNAQDYRFGLEADFHVAPRTRLDPYVGVGWGYEILHTHLQGPQVVPTAAGFAPGSVNVSVIDRGWEFVTLTGGFDGRIDPSLGIGLFASVSLNEYGVHTGTQTVSVGGTQASSGPIPDVNHGLHELYIAGVRGTFNP
jgi:hypothetical protein